MNEDLFQALHREHEGVREAFRRLQAENDPEDRTRLLFELEKEILPHLLAEERTLYPRLKTEDGAARDVLESMAEHHALRLILRDLTETPASDEVFTAKARVLEELVEHHVQEEEAAIFGHVRERLEPAERDEILRRFLSEKENIPCQPAGRGWWGGM